MNGKGVCVSFSVILDDQRKVMYYILIIFVKFNEIIHIVEKYQCSALAKEIWTM